MTGWFAPSAPVLVSVGVIAAFLLARRLADRFGNSPLLSPVAMAAIFVAIVLAVTGTPVVRFVALASPLHWALGPAIVALGAVVHGNRVALRSQAVALGLAIAGGIVIGVGSSLLLARALGLGPELTAATLTRTLSTPFAILIQTRVGGPVSLAAAFAVVAGVAGAIVLPPLFALLRLRGAATTGIATGIASHLVGTDSVGRRDAKAGAFAGTAMVVAGVLASVVLPLLWRWLLA